MLKKERYRLLIDHFSQKFPTAETELHYSNPYELLVAVILSAQCTDKRINMVTPALFERFPDPQAWPLARQRKCFSTFGRFLIPTTKLNIWSEWRGY